MTEIDTSREAVEAMAQYYAGWARDIRAQGVHSEDAIYRDKTAATIRALLAENERLREAVEEIAAPPAAAMDSADRVEALRDIARDVLKVATDD